MIFHFCVGKYPTRGLWWVRCDILSRSQNCKIVICWRTSPNNKLYYSSIQNPPKILAENFWVPNSITGLPHISNKKTDIDGSMDNGTKAGKIVSWKGMTYQLQTPPDVIWCFTFWPHFSPPKRIRWVFITLAWSIINHLPKEVWYGIPIYKKDLQ